MYYLIFSCWMSYLETLRKASWVKLRQDAGGEDAESKCVKCDQKYR